MTIAVRPGEQALQALLDRLLGPHVDVRGRLVEDQDAGLGQQRPGEGDELALAGRELHAALADLGLDPFRQRRDELGRADRGRRVLDLLQRRLGPAEGDVLAHAAGEEEALLGHDPELAPQRLLRTPRRSCPSTSTLPRCGS